MEINLSKKSWHYEIVNRYCDDYYDSSDLCSYARGVMSALAKLLLLSIVGALIFGYGFGDLFAWIAAVIKTAAWIEPNPVTIFVGGIILILSILFCGVALTALFHTSKVAKKVSAVMTPAEDSFLVQAYRGFKDKTCVRINFTS